MKKKVAVVGASGYTGGELLRLLISHDGVEVVEATSVKNEGKKVDEVHCNLKGLTRLEFSNDPVEVLAEEVDLVLFSLPHSVSMEKVPDALGKTKVIDLSADYRLKDAGIYLKYYKKHKSPELIDRFVYGLPEYNRAKIKSAELVANPGCFPTASLLSLYPLVEEGLISGKVIIDAKTGSSGSGAQPSLMTHHPERSQDLFAYKVLEHQHQPEIEQELTNVGGEGIELTFVTHSAPFVRGILVTVYASLEDKLTMEEVRDVYTRRYEDEFFVRTVERSRVTVVKGTNFCDICVKSDGDQVVMTAAIDNLVKGASGNAVQNMNLMLGYDEKEGLISTGFHP